MNLDYKGQIMFLKKLSWFLQNHDIKLVRIEYLQNPHSLSQNFLKIFWNFFENFFSAKLTQSGTNFQCLISDCIEQKVLSSRFLKLIIHARRHLLCSRNSREKNKIFTLARFRTRLCPWWDSLTTRLAIASLTISSFHWLIQLLPASKLLPVSKKKLTSPQFVYPFVRGPSVLWACPYSGIHEPLWVSLVQELCDPIGFGAWIPVLTHSLSLSSHHHFESSISQSLLLYKWFSESLELRPL